MDIEKLYLTRQSTRSYSNKPVTDEILTEICRLALLAPSARNSQPYKLYAVNGEKAKEFAPLVMPDGGNPWAAECPAFIAIEAGKGIECPDERGGKIYKTEFVEIDIGILASYITLAAENMGVQTCILGRRDEAAIAAFLGLERARFPLVVALGYKSDGYQLRKKQRRTLDESFKLIK